jgi:hypothetical protein
VLLGESYHVFLLCNLLCYVRPSLCRMVQTETAILCPTDEFLSRELLGCSRVSWTDIVLTSVASSVIFYCFHHFLTLWRRCVISILSYLECPWLKSRSGGRESWPSFSSVPLGRLRGIVLKICPEKYNYMVFYTFLLVPNIRISVTLPPLRTHLQSGCFRIRTVSDVHFYLQCKIP